MRPFLLSLSAFILGTILTVRPAAAAMTLPPQEWAMPRQGVQSFRIQCAWAASTIKKRYAGNLAAFGRRYNPYHATAWTKSVASIITRLKRLHNSRLP